MNRLTLLLGACCATGCFAPERPPMTGRVEETTLQALAVDETYRLFVRLPPEYELEPDRRFPLIVQLDANLPTLREFEVTAGLASQLEAQGKSQPAVVVGIGYASEAEAQVERARDYAPAIENAEFAQQRWANSVKPGEAAAFYAFLRDELAPHLDERYRLDGRRALFGHSMGGLFAVYALTRHDDAAPLFTGYVAASPSFFWDAGQVLGRWNSVRDPATPLVLFSAAGRLEGPEMIGFFDEFAARVEATPYERLTIGLRQYERVDHVGSVTPSFRDGLEFLFAHGFGGSP